MTNRGVTLIELVVVITIVGILTVALGFSFVGWRGGYNVEKTVKGLYETLMDTRSRALQTNRIYFFDISPDGRFYRVSMDDSNGTTKPVATGDGILQPQAAWTAIQASNPVNWGAASVITTDTTIAALSQKVDLTNNTAAIASSASPDLAGRLSARNAAPFVVGGNNFTIAFDKRGVIRNMITVATANISDAPGSLPATYGLSICIFTDYDNTLTSKYNPDYDCINIKDTKIYLGKLTTQNTAGGLCESSNCISK